jgi:hypothetical protein
MGKRRDVNWDLPFMVTFGDPVFDGGFIAVPSLFIQAYRDLGLTDMEALFLVLALEQQGRTFRMADLPLACPVRSRRRYLNSLHEKGFVFLWQTKYLPRSGYVCLDLTNLWHNLACREQWKKRSLQEAFQVTLAAPVAARIRDGQYCGVPERWQREAQGATDAEREHGDGGLEP